MCRTYTVYVRGYIIDGKSAHSRLENQEDPARGESDHWQNGVVWMKANKRKQNCANEDYFQRMLNLDVQEQLAIWRVI